MAGRKKATKVQYYGTGRRKSSVARVYLSEGTGKITVNGNPKHQQALIRQAKYLKLQLYHRIYS